MVGAWQNTLGQVADHLGMPSSGSMLWVLCKQLAHQQPQQQPPPTFDAPAQAGQRAAPGMLRSTPFHSQNLSNIPINKLTMLQRKLVEKSRQAECRPERPPPDRPTADKHVAVDAGLQG